MPVNYSTTVKNTRMTAVRDAIDAGSSAGVLEIGTTSMASVLASITLADPCGSVSSGVLTFTMPQSDTSADATGTAAEARIKDSSGTVIISGLTVGTSGSNINLSSLAVTAGDTVTLSSATITHG
jgi:hypothetical protein